MLLLGTVICIAGSVSWNLLAHRIFTCYYGNQAAGFEKKFRKSFLLWFNMIDQLDRDAYSRCRPGGVPGIKGTV